MPSRIPREDDHSAVKSWSLGRGLSHVGPGAMGQVSYPKAQGSRSSSELKSLQSALVAADRSAIWNSADGAANDSAHVLGLRRRRQTVDSPALGTVLPLSPGRGVDGEGRGADVRLNRGGDPFASRAVKPG